MLGLAGEHDHADQIVLGLESGQALHLPDPQLTLLPLPHGLVGGGAAEVLHHQAAVHAPHIGQQRVGGVQLKILFVQGTACVLDLVDALIVFDAEKHVLDADAPADDIRHLLKNIVQIQCPGYRLAEFPEPVVQHGLLLDEQLVHKPLHSQVEKVGGQHHADGDNDDGGGFRDMEGSGEEFLDGYDAAGKGDDTDQQGHSVAVPAGHQEGHAEQALFVKGVKKDKGVDDAGDDIQGKALKDGKGGENMAHYHNGRADDYRQQLLAGRTVSAAVADKQENAFQQHQPAQGQGDCHQPAVIIEELYVGAGGHNPGVGNEDAGEEVDDITDQQQDKPYVASVPFFFFQEIDDKAEVGVRQEHDPRQGHLVPHPGGGPELAAHGKGAAHPQDHDEEEKHEGADHLLGLGGGQEGDEQQEVAGQGNHGDPAKSAHTDPSSRGRPHRSAEDPPGPDCPDSSVGWAGQTVGQKMRRCRSGRW